MRPQLTQSQSILLVEDNQDDYEATCRAFKKANLRNPIVWCKSGPDALNCLKQQGAYTAAGNGPRPGLVLLDLNMPGIDAANFRGYQTGRHVETDPGDHPDYVFRRAGHSGLLPDGCQHLCTEAGEFRRADRSD